MDLIEAFKKGDKNFSFDKTVDVKKKDLKKDLNNEDDKLTFLATEKALKQYSDDYLYQAEKAFRKWVKEKLKDETWCHSNWRRKYKYSMLIKEIFGREYDHKLDGGRLSTQAMFTHYCSRVTKYYWDREKQKTYGQAAYCLSVTRCRNEAPFSVRLQAEELEKKGIMPTRYNVRIKKSLKKGQARRLETQEWLYDLQERGRKAYEKYINDQNKTKQ